ncbi:hypothetical protein D1872_192330 [compost metagenome]
MREQLFQNEIDRNVRHQHAYSADRRKQTGDNQQSTPFSGNFKQSGDARFLSHLNPSSDEVILHDLYGHVIFFCADVRGFGFGVRLK